MPVITFVTPILPGMQEEWRRFHQELSGSRRPQFGQSRRELGVTREYVWLARLTRGDMALFYYEVKDQQPLLQSLVKPRSAFDCWFSHQLQVFHGVEANLQPGELILEWP